MWLYINDKLQVLIHVSYNWDDMKTISILRTQFNSWGVLKVMCVLEEGLSYENLVDFPECSWNNELNIENLLFRVTQEGNIQGRLIKNLFDWQKNSRFSPGALKFNPGSRQRPIPQSSKL